MKYNKVTVGFVSQQYTEQEDGTFFCVNQDFIAGDEEYRENEYGESIDVDTDKEVYFQTNMIQPTKEGEIEYYYLFVRGDVEPKLVGPFVTKEAMHEAVIVKRKEEGDEHGYFAVQCLKESKLVIDSWSGGFFEE